MEVIFIINKSIYEWQKAVVREMLLLSFVTVSAFVVDIDMQDSDDRFSFLKKIDQRFSNYNAKALELSDTAIFLNTAKIKIGLISKAYNFVINLTGNETPQFKTAKILKPEINEENWKGAPLRKHKNTVIKLLASENGKNWKTENKLNFRTELGIYNNRDKAFFYFPYLITKTVSGYLNLDSSENIEKGGEPKLSLSHYYCNLLIKIFKRKINRKILNWKIVVKNGIEHNLVDQPKGSFWADPFIIDHKGKNWIFFEEFNFERNKGEISVFNLADDNKSVLQKETIISEDVHLSFPNVFKFENQFYLIPEKSEAACVDVYKAENFPYQWKKYKTLFNNTKIVDLIWLYHEGKYYVFFNKIDEHEYDNNERLYIYFSDSLFTEEWTPHPKNPVVIDKSRARNAGKFIFRNNEILRPSQDCSNRYGEKIVLNKIVKLSKTEYIEKNVETIEKPQNYMGIHTMNTNKEIYIFDILKKE